MYMLMVNAHLINQLPSVIIFYTGLLIPFSIFFFVNFFREIPVELVEAAYIDGANSFTVLRMVVLPICKPAIGAAGLFLFIHAWNEFVAGSVMVDAKDLKPIQPLLYQYIGFFGREWGPLTAAATELTEIVSGAAALQG